MPRKGGTSAKPCPGCQEQKWHEHGNVCYDCRHRLDRVQGLEQRIAELRSEAKAKVYFFSSVEHWNKGLYPGSGVDSNKVGRPYQEALRDLVIAAALEVFPIDCGISEKAIKGAEALIEREHGGGADYVLMLPRVAEKIRALDAWIRDAMPAVYDAGKEHGGSVLRQLACGSMSVTDFNDEVAVRKGKRR